jgi:hypothetical protein
MWMYIYCIVDYNERTAEAAVCCYHGRTTIDAFFLSVKLLSLLLLILLLLLFFELLSTATKCLKMSAQHVHFHSFCIDFQPIEWIFCLCFGAR